MPRKQAGRAALERAIRYVNGYIEKPRRFVNPIDWPFDEEWQVAFLEACMPHLKHEKYLTGTLLPRYVNFLEEDWALRKDDKKWKPIPPTKELFSGEPPKLGRCKTARSKGQR